MAIKGKVSIPGGIDVNNAYIKIKIGSVSEVQKPVFNQDDPPKQTGTEKEFVINYNYEFRKDSNTSEPFLNKSGAVRDADVSKNLFEQAYKHLAEALGVSNKEI